MRLVLFVRVKSFCKKKKFKIALMTSFTLLLSVLFVVEKLKSYISFSDQDLYQLEAEFVSLQSIQMICQRKHYERLSSSMAVNSMQSFTKSMSFSTTCCFKKFQVPLRQNFITCSRLCESCYVLFTAMQKKSQFFDVLRKI